MHEAALHAEALDRGTARTAGILRQVFDDIVNGIVVVVHNVHDGDGRDIACLENGLTLRVDDRVVGIDLCVDELLHDVAHIRFLLCEKFPKVAVIF